MIRQSECDVCEGEGVIPVTGSYPNDVDYEPCTCTPDTLVPSD